MRQQKRKTDELDPQAWRLVDAADAGPRIHRRLLRGSWVWLVS